MTRLDCTRFVVLGEGLAAGMTNFSLIESDQLESFPAQMARQMGVALVQPLLQAPGLGDAPGFARLPVRLPFDHQTTVLRQFPPAAKHANVSVPGLTLADALTRRPVPPVVRADDALQTAVNLVVGMDGPLTAPAQASPTPLEYVLAQKPTLAVVALGYAEALAAAVAGRADSMPEPAAFRAQFAQLVGALRATGCTVVAATIPDPVDTAYFSPLEKAARVLKVPAPVISAVYGLAPGDRVSVEALVEMGCQLIAKAPRPLPERLFLREAAATALGARVTALNAAIAAVAGEQGAVVYDLHGLFRCLRTAGLPVGDRTLSADFLGGFYSLDGYYPGRTGQALIANGVLAALNAACGATFAAIDAAAVMAGDAVAGYRLAEGPDFSPADIAAAAAAGAPPAPVPTPAAAKPSAGWAKEPKLPLVLPPGLEQVLPLSKESSYYGDALRPVHTTDPEEIFYGLSGNLLFGGLALLDSHLGGNLRIKFAPPVNGVAHFEVTHGEGLVGDDGLLSAPQFFKLPGLMNRLLDPQDVLSSGDLDLATGAVSNLKYRLFFMNSAIFSLAQENPALPKEPINFPGQYGSVWARFQQRADGLLDFEFYGTTFIPMSVLGAPSRFPLPFVSPTMRFASIPCDGTALHPHIHLSTVPPEPQDDAAEVPELPTNELRVFTASTHSNCFGDDFSLNAPQLGGPASGRSHLVGRYQVQFGERAGNTVTVAITSMMPAGLLATLPQSPIAGAFRKRIPDSLLGHDEWLRFRNSTYYNDNISWLDDPLDIAVGAVDVKTGKLVGHLLRRGMINTNWILAMLQLEPRTPKSTFEFRGPASFVKGANGETVLRYCGDLHIPFPEGFFFPASDMKTPITIGPGSALDPFLRFQGVHVPHAGEKTTWSGGSRQTTASNNVDFSYRYSITSGPGESSFELDDITGGGRFRMTRLVSVDVLNSRTSTAPAGRFDTLSFAGLGTWSEDPQGGLHTVAAQVCTSPTHPYVTVLVDGGYTRNLNTRPPNRDRTLP